MDPPSRSRSNAPVAADLLRLRLSSGSSPCLPVRQSTSWLRPPTNTERKEVMALGHTAPPLSWPPPPPRTEMMEPDTPADGVTSLMEPERKGLKVNISAGSGLGLTPAPVFSSSRRTD